MSTQQLQIVQKQNKYLLSKQSEPNVEGNPFIKQLGQILTKIKTTQLQHDYKIKNQIREFVKNWKNQYFQYCEDFKSLTQPQKFNQKLKLKTYLKQSKTLKLYPQHVQLKIHYKNLCKIQPQKEKTFFQKLADRLNLPVFVVKFLFFILLITLFYIWGKITQLLENI